MVRMMFWKYKIYTRKNKHLSYFSLSNSLVKPYLHFFPVAGCLPCCRSLPFVFYRFPPVDTPRWHSSVVLSRSLSIGEFELWGHGLSVLLLRLELQLRFFKLSQEGGSGRVLPLCRYESINLSNAVADVGSQTTACSSLALVLHRLLFLLSDWTNIILLFNLLVC